MCTKSLQWCLTLCNHMDCNPTAFSCPWDSPGKNTGVGLPFPSPGDLPNQGTGSPASQADSLLSEPRGKLINYTPI